MKDISTADTKRGFQIHAFVFVFAIAVMVVINIVTGGYPWVGWVIPSWGIGLLAHWWFGVGPGARS